MRTIAGSVKETDIGIHRGKDLQQPLLRQVRMLPRLRGDFRKVELRQQHIGQAMPVARAAFPGGDIGDTAEFAGQQRQFVGGFADVDADAGLRQLAVVVTHGWRQLGQDFFLGQVFRVHVVSPIKRMNCSAFNFSDSVFWTAARAAKRAK